MTTHYRFSARPISDRVYWERIRTDPAFASWRAANEAVVQEASEVAPHTAASDYLLTRRRNDRGRLDHVNQHHRTILTALTLRRAMRGVDPADHDDRLLDWLWAVATDASWSQANHRSRGDLPEIGSRQISIDLNSCDMAAYLAEFLEILRPWVDAQSDTLAESLLTLIDERVLSPFAQGEPVFWERPERINNWIGFCAGSILAACESLAVQGHPRPEARARAIHDLRRYLDESFTHPHGECDEGVGYWSYGWSGAAAGLSRLSAEELAQVVDMDRLRTVADYPRRAHLYANEFYASNDTPALVLPWRAFVPWLAAASGNRWLAGWMDTAAEPSRTERLLGVALRSLDSIDRQREASSSDAAPLPGQAAEPACLLPDQQVAILRAPTPAGEMVVTFTGGHNAERHNHNDLGHFQVALDGSIIVPDLGAPSPYPADFFGPDRYSHLAASSRGHNCPLIGGHEQREGQEAAARLIAWQPEGDGAGLTLDLTAAYPPEAGLQLWHRRLHRAGAPGSMTFTDTFETHPPRPVTHVIWTLERPAEDATDDGNPGRRLHFGDALACEIIPAPAQVTVEEFQADDYSLKNFPGRTLYRVSCSYEPARTLCVSTRFYARGDIRNG